MIHVIASVRVKAGRINEFLEIFKSNAPKVIEEKGCIQYLPAIDIDSGLPPQIFDEHVVTIIEKWENLDALRDHLATPHMLAYKEKVKDIVENVSLKVFQEA
ncbi:MAG: putative quinol monooxygenase [Proteobacteria bacterium]|nr:putative quinol monooxygenase [Pseudomonadota bacterium]